MPRCLLQAIERFVQFANNLPLAVEARWKNHVNILKKIPMKECIVYIKLAKKPAFHNSHCQQALHRHHLGNRAEGLNIIQAIFLGKTLGNQPSFVSFHRAIRLILDPINPVTPNGLFVWGKRSKGPSIISLQSCIVACHLGSETA